MIRRDNIGDLVCTTPLIRSLRKQLPEAHIAVLVTRYNRAVMDGNPDIDALHSYTKAKHLNHGESRIGALWERLKTIWKLRSQRFDWILLPGGPQRSALRFARWIGAPSILIREERHREAGEHHVEQCCGMLSDMGLRIEFPEATVVPDPVLVENVSHVLPPDWSERPGPLVALHLSSRKLSQRWPAERFAELSSLLHQRLGAKFLLLWSPGSAENPTHPGDDEKVEQVHSAMNGLPFSPIRTERIEDLVAAIDLCDAIICSDGGAMHLASGMGKPMVCLFGDSDPKHWGPWRCPHVVLQKPSLEVTDITVAEVAEAFEALLKKQS